MGPLFLSGFSRTTPVAWSLPCPIATRFLPSDFRSIFSYAGGASFHVCSNDPSQFLEEGP
jgi:hypothetical protein